MPHYLAGKEAYRVAKNCLCADCGGNLVMSREVDGREIISCQNCGPEFTRWVSQKKTNKSLIEIDQVIENYPELEPGMTRIKTLRYNKPAFPEIGQIRKGVKEEVTRKDGSKYTRPKDLDHFRVVFVEGEEDARDRFVEEYGEEPREINIRLPFNDVNKLWTSSLVGFVAGGLLAQSDGETYQFLRDGITGEVIVVNGRHVETGEPLYYDPEICPTNYIDGKGNEKGLELEPSGLLKVMVPELGRAAFLTLVTNSWHDIETIPAHLDGLHAFTDGRLTGLPLVLKRRPAMISTPGKDGKRVRREKWLCQIEVEKKYANFRFAELEKAIYEGPQLEGGEDEVLSLPEHVEIDPPDYGRYVEHTTGEILEGDYEDEEEEVEEVDNSLTPGLVRTVDEYRALCKRAGLDKDESNAIWNECKRDNSKAYDQVLKQYGEVLK